MLPSPFGGTLSFDLNSVLVSRMALEQSVIEQFDLCIESGALFAEGLQIENFNKLRWIFLLETFSLLKSPSWTYSRAVSLTARPISASLMALNALHSKFRQLKAPSLNILSLSVWLGRWFNLRPDQAKYTSDSVCFRSPLVRWQNRSVAVFRALEIQRAVHYRSDFKFVISTCFVSHCFGSSRRDAAANGIEFFSVCERFVGGFQKLSEASCAENEFVFRPDSRNESLLFLRNSRKFQVRQRTSRISYRLQNWLERHSYR